MTIFHVCYRRVVESGLHVRLVGHSVELRGLGISSLVSDCGPASAFSSRHGEASMLPIRAGSAATAINRDLELHRRLSRALPNEWNCLYIPIPTKSQQEQQCDHDEDRTTTYRSC